MTDSFRGFRCWSTASVQRSVFDDIGALGLDADAVFLAAHTPVDVTHAKGVAVGARGEQAVLQALRDSFHTPDENTLIAITGPSGAGKSHLVRWVRAHLDDSAGDYRIIYVPRDLSTLRALIGRILDGMPGERADTVRDHLDEAVTNKSPAQLTTALLNNLREVLAHELTDEGDGEPELRTFLLGQRPEAQSRRQNGLADLLHNLRIIDHLSRPDGTPQRVVHSLKGELHGRDEELSQFTAADLPIREGGVRPSLDGSVIPVWNTILRDPTPAVNLLNEALRRAIPMTIGMRPGATLTDVFRETREVLRSHGADLVLLFEDLALFGLIDAELFDQFVQQPGDSLCPLRVLFAITDSKFANNVPETVKTRLAHHFEAEDLDSARGGVPARTPVEFVARYLNVARVGRDRLIEAWTAADPQARASGEWIPNECATRENGGPCRHRDTCFAGFGHVEASTIGDIGLYPYNQTALLRAFRKMGPQLSPRALVQEVVHDLLITADLEIADGTFPSAQAQRWFDFATSRGRDAVVPATAALTEMERERLHRTRVIWADGFQEPTAVRLAFALPTADATARGQTPAPTPERVPEPESRPLDPIFRWENNEPLPDKQMEESRALLHRLVSARLDLGRRLIHVDSGTGQAVLGDIFPPISFVFANAPGRVPAERRVRFDIANNREGVLLLIAARWFADHGHWQPTHEQRQWQFPDGYDPLELQLTLDNFLDDCAATVERTFLQVCSRSGADPASCAVTLRSAALRFIGAATAAEATVAGLQVATREPAAEARWSPVWSPVARASLTALRSVKVHLIGEFASARQGDTGEPIVVDAARLETALERAVREPVEAVHSLDPFDERLSELETARIHLSADWSDAIAQEAADLDTTLADIGALIGGNSLADLVRRATDFGRQANEAGMFRPVQTYPSFRQALDLLESTQTGQVNAWVSSHRSGAAQQSFVFDAQAWAGHARAVAQAAEIAKTSIVETRAELERRITQSTGADPDTVAATVANKVDRLAALLTHLGAPRRQP